MTDPALAPSWCNFCGRAEAQVDLIVRGGRGAICSSCLEAAHAVLVDEGGDLDDENSDDGDASPSFGRAPIRGALAQIWVPDIDVALPLYQRLAGTADVRRLRSDDL